MTSSLQRVFNIFLCFLFMTSFLTARCLASEEFPSQEQNETQSASVPALNNNTDKKPEHTSENNSPYHANDEFSWQITLGVSVGYTNDILVGNNDENNAHNMLIIPLLVDAYYKGFFIQSSQRRMDGLFGSTEIGYQLSASPSWSVEIITKAYIGEIDAAEVIENNELENSILEGLPKRKTGQGLGLRYSKFINDDIFSIDVASLVSIDADKPFVIDMYYSHFIPYYNWNIYLGGGATYFSQSATNYYIGIDHDETTEQRPYYQANSGSFSAQVELFSLYPINENWSFNAGINHTLYSTEVADSPIIERPDSTVVSMGVLYAF